MSIYYFHIRTSRDRIPDPDGEEFASLDAALAAAKADLRHLIAEHVKIGRLMDLRGIDVEDAAGTILASVTVMEVLRELLPGLTER